MAHSKSIILLLATVSMAAILPSLFSSSSQSQSPQLTQPCPSIQAGRAANLPPDPNWESKNQWKVFSQNNSKKEGDISNKERGREETITAIAFSPNNKFLATGTKYVNAKGNDVLGNVKVWWNLEVDNRKLNITHQGNSQINALAFSSNGVYLGAVSDAGKVWLWSYQQWQQKGVRRFFEGGNQIKSRSIVFSPDNRVLVIGGAVRTGQPSILRWSISANGMLQPIRRPLQEVKKFSPTSNTAESQEINSLAFSPNGKIIAAAGTANLYQKEAFRTIKKLYVDLWDAESGKHLCTLDNSGFSSPSIAFSPNGTVFAAADKSGGIVRLWSLPNLEPLPSLNHGGQVNAIAFSPSGEVLLSGGVDRKVNLWRVKTGQEIATTSNHDGEVTSVAFRADGKAFATGGMDKKFRTYIYRDK